MLITTVITLDQHEDAELELHKIKGEIEFIGPRNQAVRLKAMIMRKDDCFARAFNVLDKSCKNCTAPIICGSQSMTVNDLCEKIYLKFKAKIPRKEMNESKETE